MKDVLFLCPCDIEDPKRGTPIRIKAILDQLRGVSDLNIHVYEGNGKKTVQKFQELRDRPEEIFFGNTHKDLWVLFLCKLFLRKKVVIDLHGAWEEELFAYGQISWLHKVFLRMAYRISLSFFDLISVVNGNVKTTFFSNMKDVVVTYPGVNPSDIPSAETIPLRQDTDPLRIGYIGNARAYQGADVTLRIARRLRDERLPFKLVVISSEEDWMKSLIRREYGEIDSCIETRYNLSHEDALRETATCEVLLILRPKNPVTDFSFPSKLAEYLATGRTTIVTKFADVASVIQDGLDAYLISSDQREEETYRLLIEIIQKKRAMLDPSTVRSRCIERFSWSTVTRPLIQALCQM